MTPIDMFNELFALVTEKHPEYATHDESGLREIRFKEGPYYYVATCFDEDIVAGRTDLATWCYSDRDYDDIITVLEAFYEYMLWP